jgi:hypothetical protein
VADAPENFLDPLLLTLMKDPVLLKTSGNIVDRSTIATQLLNDPLDPFNRAPLSWDEIEPVAGLKAEIESWIREKVADAKDAKATATVATPEAAASSMDM